ncbi:MAG: WhiB family transcriptional regulator [Actinophytocola sp.]|uniref:WhiB family transcriptional regulator n=1 Tax=Actinophytocola sp. TaxID=1872138 RepID=UPI00132B909B|nr:WhiB family transcriptional regulator [Actinophytocola sp.]MPZ80884.1 WhiB family transcriptional regulator [Actinophytocola sp.]
MNYFEELASRLDRFEHVPDDVLWDIVTHEGTCTWLYANDLKPDWTGESLTDREVAARICAGCTARWACLELELRTHGDQAIGVWGALPAEDIRALHPVWRARRQGRRRTP